MDEVEAKREPELLAGKMCLRASPRGTKAVFAGIGLDEVDKLLDRLRRHRRIDGEDGGRGDGERDRLEIFDGVVRDAGEQRRVDHMGDERNQERVAVRRSLRYRAVAN